MLEGIEIIEGILSYSVTVHNEGTNNESTTLMLYDVKTGTEEFGLEIFPYSPEVIVHFGWGFEGTWFPFLPAALTAIRERYLSA